MLRVASTYMLTAMLFTVSTVEAQSTSRRESRPGQSARPRPSYRRADSVKEQLAAREYIDKVLWWLPENTETVAVARGPYRLHAPMKELPTHITAVGIIRLHLQGDAAPFGVIKGGRYYSQYLTGRTVSFSVEGSRRFREPASLGSMTFEGCNVVVFEPGLGPSREKLMATLATDARNVQQVEGQQVLMFEEKLEEDTWSIYVAMPERDVLLCATDASYLKEVLARMRQHGQRRALPEDLAEWRVVDTAAPFWAVRHYDKSQAQADPSSPLSGQQMAANWPDTQAVGVTFDFDPDRSKAGKIKYLSANKDALQVFSKLQEKTGIEWRIHQSESGVIEMVTSLNDEEHASLFLMSLLAMLGHGIYP